MAKSGTGTRKGKRKKKDFTRSEMLVGAVVGAPLMLVLAPDVFWDRPVTRKVRDVFEWIWHHLMIMALVGTYVWMAWVAAGGTNTTLFIEIAIPATVVAFRYGPWYMMVGMLPYWFFCSGVMATCYGGWWQGGGLISQHDLAGPALTSWLMWWWVAWLFYSFVRGVFHQIGREQERLHHLKKHKAVNHPYALMGTGTAITALTSLPAKKERQKAEQGGDRQGGFMSHQHFCDVEGHWRERGAKALRACEAQSLSTGPCRTIIFQEAIMMRLTCAAAILSLLAGAGNARAAGRFIPAGLPIACWMQEKDLSLKTAEVGDPVLCYLSSAMNFGRSLFPRGSYLTRRIGGGKVPGRLVGKGSLVLDFDRLVVSDSIRVPISVKVIAALKYRVSPDGKVIGKGHARRDLAEWMFPPLWPLKAATLIGRGPWPAVTGKEERLLLRVMQDAVVPDISGGIPEYTPAAGAASSYYENPVHVGGDVVLIRKDGSAVYVIDYWYSVPGYVSYALKDNLFGRIPLSELNMKATMRVNGQRGIRFRVVR